ncbi:unnamed protein product [Pseudo-nitzschia multistriata]|uniref:Uncharacterized protein n=1 Tax=Pseudo-nitzschia multistriata TaxID=183589 RepID=A0A448YUS0_9STRA|nr:unnamed protein product [Pseudo-nitzschia multistriata]
MDTVSVAVSSSPISKSSERIQAGKGWGIFFLNPILYSFMDLGAMLSKTGLKVSARAPTPTRAKYPPMRRFTRSSPKNLKARYNPKREQLPMIGNCMASSVFSVSFAGASGSYPSSPSLGTSSLNTSDEWQATYKIAVTKTNRWTTYGTKTNCDAPHTIAIVAYAKVNKGSFVFVAESLIFLIFLQFLDEIRQTATWKTIL